MSNDEEDTSFSLLGLPQNSDTEGLRSRQPFELLATQYVDELRKGLAPSVELYARRFPPHADRIREYFPLLTMLEHARIESEASALRLSMPDRFSFNRLAGHELLCELGRGGMGIVYQGREISSRRIVALKILPWRTSIVPEWMKKFEREARIASRIRHPNVVPVFECGEETGYIYYTMQFVNGVGLDRIITRLQHTTSVVFKEEMELVRRFRPFGFVDPIPDTDSPAACSANKDDEPPQRQISRNSWRGFAQIAMQTAAALHAAHEAGIIHNDIKPANLLLDESGHVWVADFGLSQPFDPVSVFSRDEDGRQRQRRQNNSSTQLYGMRNQQPTIPPADNDESSRLSGTLRYMAPERLMGRKADVRTDLYALGVTLYELSLQTPAFPSLNRDQLLRNILDESPIAPRLIRKDIPKDLETIIQNCIARDPSSRYPTAAAMHADLLAFCKGQKVSAVSPTGIQSLFRSVHGRIRKQP